MSTLTKTQTELDRVTVAVDATQAQYEPSEKAAGRIPWPSILKYIGSLLDQSFVSGTRFLTTILVARMCGASELGTYALGFSVMMGFHCLHISLFCRPYTIYANKVSGQAHRELAGSVLMQFLGFSLLSSIMLAVGSAALYASDVQTGMTGVLLILAIGTPFILLRDHARQFCFAHLNVHRALLVDVMTASIQLSAIGLLAWQTQLTAVTALAATSVGCGVAGIVWLWLDRHRFAIRFSRIMSDMRDQWFIGKWDCASEIVFTSQIHGMTWLLAILLDRGSVGVYSACMTAIMVLNPFLLGVNSLLVPKTAKAFADHGILGMRNIVGRTTILLGGLTTGFAVVAAIWGPAALELLYHGQGFEIPTMVVAALVFGVVAEVLGIGPENALWAMERHDLNFRVELVGGAGTLVSSFLLIPSLGLPGAALSFLVGRAMTSVAHWYAYRVAIRQQLRRNVTASELA